MKIIIQILLTTLIAMSTMAQHSNIRNQKDRALCFKGMANGQCMNVFINVMANIMTTKSKQAFGKMILRFAIRPHDDYTYAAFLYKEVFSHIKAKTVIILVWRTKPSNSK